MLLDTLIDFFANYGYHAVFISLIISGLGVPIPEDITLVAAGVISGLDLAHIELMLLTSFAGVMLGDSVMFFLGHRFGEKVFEIGFFRKMVTPKRYETAQRKFDKYGNWILFIARFLPGLRAVIFLIAGTMPKIKYWRFFLMDGMAALLSIPVWIMMGHLGAENHEVLLLWIKRSQHIIFSVLAVVLLYLLVYYFYRKRFPKKDN